MVGKYLIRAGNKDNKTKVFLIVGFSWKEKAPDFSGAFVFVKQGVGSKR
jgi:hypothetical protein